MLIPQQQRQTENELRRSVASQAHTAPMAAANRAKHPCPELFLRRTAAENSLDAVSTGLAEARAHSRRWPNIALSRRQ
jgi:hypothetical protein